MPDDALLSVRALRKEFVVHAIRRHVLALDDVSLDVAAGEHVVLVGPSGAGKSTLLRCVWRSCLPTAGQVLLRRAGGEVVDLARLSDDQMGAVRDEDMGYVSQFLRPEPRRSVLDIVSRAATRGGLDHTAALAASRAALSAARVAESLWGTYPVLLSGGEQQRVNLAAGTIRPPRLLLLDEPVSALDKENGEAVLALVEGIAATGTAVLSIFHDMDAVRRLATRVVYLEEGGVVDDGPPDEVISRRIEAEHEGAA
jgi:alpha-D-ribose 1-methylphosphonate 5-triphosphate synthase subunit PhnL